MSFPIKDEIYICFCIVLHCILGFCFPCSSSDQSTIIIILLVNALACVIYSNEGNHAYYHYCTKMTLPCFTEWTLSGQNMHAEASTSAIDSGSNQLSKSRRLTHSKLVKYASKFLDDTVPFRKKVWDVNLWLYFCLLCFCVNTCIELNSHGTSLLN